MKILLSLNYKFFEINSNNAFQILKDNDLNKNIDGFEVNIKSYNDSIYLKEFIKECNKQNYILNLHSPTFNNIKEYEKYFDVINEITSVYNNKINVVFHPIVMKSIEESIAETKKYLSKIYKYIDDKQYKNIVLSIENLNDINGLIRLKKESFRTILKKFDDLMFTYDIGHEFIEDSLNCTKKFPLYLKNRLNNVHIHSFVGREDHYPIKDIYGKDKKIFSRFKKIKEDGFDGFVVAEYALDYMDGNTIEERFADYINKTVWLKEKLENV